MNADVLKEMIKVNQNQLILEIQNFYECIYKDKGNEQKVKNIIDNATKT